MNNFILQKNLTCGWHTFIPKNNPKFRQRMSKKETWSNVYVSANWTNPWNEATFWRVVFWLYFWFDRNLTKTKYSDGYLNQHIIHKFYQPHFSLPQMLTSGSNQPLSNHSYVFEKICCLLPFTETNLLTFLVHRSCLIATPATQSDTLCHSSSSPTAAGWKQKQGGNKQKPCRQNEILMILVFRSSRTEKSASGYWCQHSGICGG